MHTYTHTHMHIHTHTHTHLCTHTHMHTQTIDQVLGLLHDGTNPGVASALGKLADEHSEARYIVRVAARQALAHGADDS